MAKSRSRIAGLVFLMLVLSLGGLLSGAPRLDVVSVHVGADGTQLVLSGGGFGTRVAVSPLRWDDFGAGSDGGELMGWLGDGHAGHYSSRYKHSGTLSARFRYPVVGDSECGYLTGLATKELYLSYWVYIHREAGNLSSMIKLARGSASTPGDLIHGEPNFGYMSSWHREVGPYGYFFTNSLNDPYMVYQDYVTEGVWHRVDMWVRLSSAPGIADGRRRFFLDGVRQTRPGANDDAYPTLYQGAVADRFDNVVLGVYVDHELGQVGGDYSLYYDDVYVDRTLARIELCDSAAWPAGSTPAHCEVQIPLSWSETSITARANLGSFANFNGLYAFVVDASGAVTKGIPVGNGTTPPKAPTGVIIK